jgi:hypothetical protein
MLDTNINDITSMILEVRAPLARAWMKADMIEKQRLIDTEKKKKKVEFCWYNPERR